MTGRQSRPHHPALHRALGSALCTLTWTLGPHNPLSCADGRKSSFPCSSITKKKIGILHNFSFHAVMPSSEWYKGYLLKFNHILVQNCESRACLFVCLSWIFFKEGGIWDPTAWLTHGFPLSILYPWQAGPPRKDRIEHWFPSFYHSQSCIFFWGH